MLSPATPAKTVGIWIRVSTEEQVQGESPEHHERRARAYAESRGWQVIEVYRLEAVSGKSVMQHPEARRMLADVRGGRITGLIFSKLARLARNTKELLEFAEIFRGVNADLVSLQEAIDTSTPAGRLFYTVIAAMAQWEREEIAERVSASVVIRAKMGKPLNGKLPYGFAWNDKRIVHHPVEAPIRKLIYELFLECRRKKAVARMLNERGFRTREGRLFTDSTIEHLIRDPAAKGLHRANYSTRRPGKFKLIKPESEWVWTPIEPLVPVELWNECNQYLDERRARSHKRPGRRPVHLFAGYAFCTCGRKMYVMSGTPKYVCPACRNRIPIVDLEAIYREQLRSYFLSPGELAAQLERATEGVREREQLASALTHEQEKLQAEIDRVYQLYVGGQIDAPAFGTFYAPLDTRRRAIADELPRVQAQLDLLRITSLSADHIATEVCTLHDTWPTLNRDEKRRIIESITDRIVIGRDAIDIKLCYHPTSEKTTKRLRNLPLDALSVDS